MDKNSNEMKQDILEIAQELEKRQITTEEAKEQLLVLFGVAGQSEQLKAEEEPLVKGEQYVADYVAKHGKDLTSL